jgi:hypothetical protein
VAEKNRARRNRERMVSSYFQEKLKIVKEFLTKNAEEREY